MPKVAKVVLIFDNGDEQRIEGDKVATRGSHVLELYAKRDEQPPPDPLQNLMYQGIEPTEYVEPTAYLPIGPPTVFDHILNDEDEL